VREEEVFFERKNSRAVVEVFKRGGHRSMVAFPSFLELFLVHALALSLFLAHLEGEHVVADDDGEREGHFPWNIKREKEGEKRQRRDWWSMLSRLFEGGRRKKKVGGRNPVFSSASLLSSPCSFLLPEGNSASLFDFPYSRELRQPAMLQARAQRRPLAALLLAAALVFLSASTTFATAVQAEQGGARAFTTATHAAAEQPSSSSSSSSSSTLATANALRLPMMLATSPQPQQVVTSPNLSAEQQQQQLIAALSQVQQPATRFVDVGDVVRVVGAASAASSAAEEQQQQRPNTSLVDTDALFSAAAAQLLSGNDEDGKQAAAAAVSPLEGVEAVRMTAATPLQGAQQHPAFVLSSSLSEANALPASLVAAASEQQQQQMQQQMQQQPMMMVMSVPGNGHVQQQLSFGGGGPAPSPSSASAAAAETIAAVFAQALSASAASSPPPLPSPSPPLLSKPGYASCDPGPVPEPAPRSAEPAWMAASRALAAEVSAAAAAAASPPRASSSPALDLLLVGDGTFEAFRETRLGAPSGYFSGAKKVFDAWYGAGKGRRAAVLALDGDQSMHVAWRLTTTAAGSGDAGRGGGKQLAPWARETSGPSAPSSPRAPSPLAPSAVVVLAGAEDLVAACGTADGRFPGDPAVEETFPYLEEAAWSTVDRMVRDASFFFFFCSSLFFSPLSLSLSLAFSLSLFPPTRLLSLLNSPK